MILAILAVVSCSLWFAHHVRDQRKKAEREASYQAVLAQYADLKPGMKREQVEGYFQTNGKRVRQMCCVAMFRGEFVGSTSGIATSLSGTAISSALGNSLAWRQQ